MNGPSLRQHLLAESRRPSARGRRGDGLRAPELAAGRRAQLAIGRRAARKRQPCSWAADGAGPTPRRSRWATSGGGRAGGALWTAHGRRRGRCTGAPARRRFQALSLPEPAGKRVRGKILSGWPDDLHGVISVLRFEQSTTQSRIHLRDTTRRTLRSHSRE